MFKTIYPTQITPPSSGVTEDVYDKLLNFQQRCVVCGSTYALQVHHRIFRSEGEGGLRVFLEKALPLYQKCYRRSIKFWRMHDIQNLVVLCVECHEGQNGRGIHGGNIKLSNFIKSRFTCPYTGVQIPYFKSLF